MGWGWGTGSGVGKRVRELDLCRVGSGFRVGSRVGGGEPALCRLGWGEGTGSGLGIRVRVGD